VSDIHSLRSVRFGEEFGRLPRVEVQQTLGGRYKLLNELGHGGMAVVWRARDEVLGRSVAVKLLAGRFANDPSSRSRIRDEARAAAALSPHPHIAQVYDFGESDADGDLLPYVVMELVNGPTLQQKAAIGPMPPRTVFQICGEVASALAAAHADGLVHRDIKPANVMVTAIGAKVVDFGIAAVAGPGDPDDVLLGTPAYLAPERLTGDAVEPATDVYALGVLLYRLLANVSPWTVDSTTQMLSAHIYIEPTPMPRLPGVPDDVIDLVHRCLRKDPADRPTAAEAATILTDAAEAGVREESESISFPLPAPYDPAQGTGSQVPPAAGNLPGQRRAQALERLQAAHAEMLAGGAAAPAAQAGGAAAPAGHAGGAAAPAGHAGGAAAPAGRAGGAAAPAGGAAAPGGKASAVSAPAGKAAGTSPPGGRAGGTATAGGKAGGASALAGNAAGASAPGKASGASAATHRGALPAEAAALGGAALAGPRGAESGNAERGSAGLTNAGPKNSAPANPALTSGGPGAGHQNGPDRKAPGHQTPDGGKPAGASGVPEGNRKRKRGLLIAGGGLAAVVVAVLLLWLFLPVDADGGQDSAKAPVPATTARVPAGATDPPGTTAADQPGGGPGAPNGGAVQPGTTPLPGTAQNSRGPAAGVPEGAGPSSPGSQPSTSSTRASSAPSASTTPTKTLSSSAGTVQARCTGGKALLTSWHATDPYTVERVNAGPVLAASIVFTHPGSRIRMTVTCVGGVPTAVVLPL
jgi:predicted Ser/Thr protein kinase